MGCLDEEDVVISVPGIQGWEAKEISSKNLSCIIQARMEDIIECILFHIKESGYYEKLGAGIVITGGGALLKNIIELIKFRTALDVRMGYPTQFFKENSVPQHELPLYATAVGLMVSHSLYASPIVFKQKLFDEDEVPIADKDKDKDKDKQKSVNKKGSGKKQDRTKDIKGDLFGNIIFGNIKKSLAGMFVEKDTEM